MKALIGFWSTALMIFAFLSAASSAQNRSTPEVIDPSQTHHLESVMGREVRTPQGDSGRIIDLLADRDGRLQAAVVEMGGFLGIGTRKIAIDWRAFRFDRQDSKSFLIIEIDRERLRLAPEYTTNIPVIVPVDD